MTDPCDVCGAAGSMTPLVDAALAGLGKVRIHRCAACGFRQVRPRPAPEATEALYDADYFDSAALHGFAEYARQRQRYERDAFFLARELEALGASGRFLEVGSALGFLLDALSRSTRWEVEGVEASAFGAWYARSRFGVTVRRGTMETARFPPERFDYVLQKDLLEHVTHPRRHLEETCRIMRRGARMRVITPNGAADVRPLRRAAAAARPGELPALGQGHLSFFSRPQLLRLVEDAGFRVLRCRRIGWRRGLRALGAVPGWRARAPLTAPAPDVPPAAAGRGDRDGAAGPDQTYEARAARIDAKIAERHRRVRSWRPYHHYRRLAKRLDAALASALAAGRDFDLLAEKR